MRQIKIVTILISFFVLNNLQAQWKQISAIPSQKIVALAEVSNIIFAASGTNLLYKSNDAGITWNPINVSNQLINIITLKIIDGKIYVGTLNHGIFISIDFGDTWVNYGGISLAVSGIEKKGSNIYASTLGDGIYVYNQNTSSWISFNNSLPSYSVNVETIVATTTNLIIGAGANGTFYYYDFIKNQWVEEYFKGSLSPGLQIDKIINYSDTLFATNGQNIFRSNDGGLNWSNDKIDSHNGQSRFIYKGINNYYTITNVFNGFNSDTWIQKIDRNSSIGNTWACKEEFIKGYSFDIIELQDKLFLAKEDGLYTKNIVLGVHNNNSLENELKIFPNPSNGKNIAISSPIQVDNCSINNYLGQTIYSEKILKKDFEIQHNFLSDIYFLTFYFCDGTILSKKLIID